MFPCALFCCVSRPQPLLLGLEGNGDYRVCQRKLAYLQVQGVSGTFVCGVGLLKINDSKGRRHEPWTVFLIDGAPR